MWGHVRPQPLSLAETMAKQTLLDFDFYQIDRFRSIKWA